MAQLAFSILIGFWIESLQSWPATIVWQNVSQSPICSREESICSIQNNKLTHNSHLVVMILKVFCGWIKIIRCRNGILLFGLQKSWLTKHIPIWTEIFGFSLSFGYFGWVTPIQDDLILIFAISTFQTLEIHKRAENIRKNSNYS